MARSKEEIQLEMVTAKEADPTLKELNSSSQTAIWNLWTFIVAGALHIHETLFDKFKAEVEEVLDSRVPGTASWYAERLRDFQRDTELPEGSTVYAPDEIKEEKRFISRVSYFEVDGTLFLKATKNDVDDPNVLAALTLEEQANASAYIESIKYAGTKVNIDSKAADTLFIQANIFYDKLYTAETVRTKVANAIRNYLEELDFTGYVYVNDVTDAIQTVKEVRDVKIKEMSISSDTDTAYRRKY